MQASMQKTWPSVDHFAEVRCAQAAFERISTAFSCQGMHLRIAFVKERSPTEVKRGRVHVFGVRMQSTFLVLTS